MKGVINKGIQELVTEAFGAEAWGEIKRRAGCEEPFFSASRDYPDAMTLDLVAAVAEVSGLSADAILERFGRFWVPNTGARAYPQLYAMAGRTAREFLLNLDRVHQHVTRSIENAAPPRFSYDELPDGRLRLHYSSGRRLCAALRGLILGVGEHFDERLEVRELRCMKDGHDDCVMEVSFDA